MKKCTGVGPVVFAAVLTAAVLVSAVSLWMLSFRTVQQVSHMHQEQARMEAEIKGRFSYIMTSYRLEGWRLVVDGYFRNTDPEHHLLKMDLFLVSAEDSLGQRIGIHIMNADTARDLRIPARSEVPYSFRIYLHPHDKADQFVISEQGPDLHLLGNFTLGKCIGEECFWCDHHWQIPAPILS